MRNPVRTHSVVPSYCISSYDYNRSVTEHLLATLCCLACFAYPQPYFISPTRDPFLLSLSSSAALKPPKQNGVWARSLLSLAGITSSGDSLVRHSTPGPRPSPVRPLRTIICKAVDGIISPTRRIRNIGISPDCHDNQDNVVVQTKVSPCTDHQRPKTVWQTVPQGTQSNLETQPAGTHASTLLPKQASATSTTV